MSEETKPANNNRLVIFIFALVVLCGGLWGLSSLASGGDGDDSNGTESSSCTSGSYRNAATPLMDDLSDIINDTNIRDANSRQDAINDTTAVLVKINRLDCRDEFPLKHESLEYTAIHFRDAMEAMNDGDAASASESLSAATLNAERFNDWSVDMDN